MESSKSVKIMIDSASDISESEAKELDICVYAVIDTLKYLKKGGRISATTAFVQEMMKLILKSIKKMQRNY